MSALPSLPPPGPGHVLSPLQKAAVVFRMLGALGIRLPDDALSGEDRARLEATMRGLEGLEPVTLAGVIDEFLATLGGAPPPGPSPVLAGPPPLPDLPELPTLMDLGTPDTEVGPEPGADDWDRIAGLDDDRLAAILEAEAPEVAAVIMSKFKVSRSAALLGRLPGPRARRIAHAMSKIDGARPEAVELIARTLRGGLGAEPARAFSDGPVERVGAILNFSRAAIRNDVLTGLDETDPEFAEAVRKSIFTFANIPARIDPRDIPKIVRQIDQKVLVTALKAAEGSEELTKACDFILANISQRMAEAIRGEVADRADVKGADGETAMTAVVTVIRDLEDAGEIYLVAEDEEDG